MKILIGDIVKSGNIKGEVKSLIMGTKEPVAVIESTEDVNPFSFLNGKTPTVTTHKIVISKLKVVNSIIDHYFILKIGDSITPFNSKESLLQAITPKNFDKVELYEISK